MSKDVRKPDSDNWEKSETAGRFVRDVVIVAIILGGAFAWYYKTSQDKAAADKIAVEAKELIVKDDPRSYEAAEKKLQEVLGSYVSDHAYSLAALAELNTILYAEHKVADRKAAAQDFVDRAVQRKTSTAEEYASRALLLVADGKAAEAERFLNAEVIEKDAGGARIFAALGMALEAQGKVAEARRAFKAAVDADWRNPRFAVLIGDSYLREGDAANALSYYQRGLQSNSEHLGSSIGAARARLNSGTGLKEAEDAIKAAFEREDQLTPRLKAALYVARAEHELVQQKVDEALATVTQAIEADPTYSWSYAVQAKAHAAKKDEAALASWDKAIEMEPYASAYYYQATQSLLGAGLDQDKALSYMEKYPLKKDDKYFYAYGNALVAVGKLDDALARYADGIEQSEVNGDIYVAQARIYRQQEKYDEAEAALEKAQIAKEFNPDLYVEKAMLRFAKKQYEEGMQEYATALTQWRQARVSREQLTAYIAGVKDMLTRAGQRQYAQIWETEATNLIR